jgi:hypothetical protein
MDVNGFIDMNRDIIIRLIGIVKDVVKIRVVHFLSFFFFFDSLLFLKIIGVCEKTFRWKTHSFFLKIRRESLLLFFCFEKTLN